MADATLPCASVSPGASTKGPLTGAPPGPRTRKGGGPLPGSPAGLNPPGPTRTMPGGTAAGGRTVPFAGGCQAACCACWCGGGSGTAAAGGGGSRCAGIPDLAAASVGMGGGLTSVPIYCKLLGSIYTPSLGGLGRWGQAVASGPAPMKHTPHWKVILCTGGSRPASSRQLGWRAGRWRRGPPPLLSVLPRDSHHASLILGKVPADQQRDGTTLSTLMALVPRLGTTRSVV